MISSLLKDVIGLVPWRWRRVIRKVPLIAPLQRRLLEKYLEGREFVHTVDAGPAKGLRYPILLPEDKGIWSGTYELNLASRIADAVKPDDVCFDIGGWHGFFGGVMALAGARRVIVFEPLPANITRIRYMMDLNPQLPIELINAAVGEEDGTAAFCVMPDSSMGKLAISLFQQTRPISDIVHVPLVSLDGLLNSGAIEPCSVMKIDVEGSELFVLRSARNLLVTHRPKLFVEAHSKRLLSECRSFLSGVGYELDLLRPIQGDNSQQTEICHFVARAQPL